MQSLLFALEQSPLGLAMRTSEWLYPAVNVGHVLAAATAFGSMLLAHLRVLGVAGGLVAAGPFFRYAIACTLAAAFLGVATGLMLFAADPQVVAQSPFFRLEPVLLGGLALTA